MATFRTSDLPKALRAQIGAERRAELAAAARPCGVGSFLPCRVPTVGLHAKDNAHHDRPALRAAKALYATGLPRLAAPVAGPIVLTVDFVLQPGRGMQRFDGVRPYGQKPDLSNLVKVFEDALRRAEWMLDDAQVVGHQTAKWVTFEEPKQGVFFTVETTTGAAECIRTAPDWGRIGTILPARKVTYFWGEA